MALTPEQSNNILIAYGAANTVYNIEHGRLGCTGLAQPTVLSLCSPTFTKDKLKRSVGIHEPVREG